MLAAIATGHTDLADILFLIAAIIFALAGMITTTQRPDPSNGALIPAGLALLAIALLVL
jgi:hypothetical protein